MQKPRLTILGAGYVGKALLARFPDADHTRRAATDAPRAHRFDLDDTGTWGNPPCAGRQIVWTFPAAPLERVQAFHHRHLREAGALIVLGSTSAYRIDDSDAVPTVDETSPLDLEQPRVAGEEWLRLQGATVLQLAGIIGPGRDPLDWLRRGRIRDGAKLVNLVHVEDIVAVIAQFLAHPAPGERINVTGGEALAWRELVAHYQAAGELPGDFCLPESTTGVVGKRVDHRRLREMLPGYSLRSHPP